MTTALSHPDIKKWLSLVLSRSSITAKLLTVGAAFVVSAAVLSYLDSGLRTVEERIGALGWTSSPDNITEERVAMVVVDEASIAEIGPWPWERSEMARLVDAIDEAGAQLQVFDVVFPESKPGDDTLARSLQEARGGSLIAQLPDLNGGNKSSNVGLLTHPIAGISCESSGPIQIPRASGHIAPNATFSDVPKGHIGALIDPDGAVRQSPAFVCHDGEVFPSLATASLIQLSGGSYWEASVSTGSSFFGPRAVLSIEGLPGLEIPLNESGSMRISFAKSPDAFTAISAADVMAGRADLSILEDALVLVGGTAFGMSDIVPTPYSGAVPGVELQARLLSSILDSQVPYSPAGAGIFSLFLCLIFAAVLLSFSVAGGKITAVALPVAAIVLPVAALWLHIYFLQTTNIWIGWIDAAVFGFAASAMLVLLDLARVRLERAQIFNNLNSYLPNDMARKIAYALPSATVDAQRRDVTLLSADLRNFSAFGEARPPEETAAVLHYFFTKSTAIIEAHGGRVQEFRGDSLLAIWDDVQHSDAKLSLHAALELQRSLDETLLPFEALEGLEPLALGIGIEQGPVLVGSIGPAHRRSLTMLGDTLSITLRIQEMTAELAQPILLGECVARQLTDDKLESQGTYLLNGLRIPHTLFSPYLEDFARAGQDRNNQPELTVVGGGKR